MLTRGGRQMRKREDSMSDTGRTDPSNSVRRQKHDDASGRRQGS